VVPNTPEDRRGLANRVFAGLAPLALLRRRLKSTSQPLYLVIKWSASMLLLLLPLLLAEGVVLLLRWLM
jgi:beta-hydroxylase